MLDKVGYVGVYEVFQANNKHTFSRKRCNVARSALMEGAVCGSDGKRG